jgi:hypothetical protein
MPTPTQSQPQVFTLEAVNSLIPRLNAICAEQLLRRAEIETLLKELAQRTGGEPPDSLSIDDDDPPELKELKGDLIARIEQYQQGWGALEEMGAVLKDPRIGLVDFYGRVEGKLVWLCWKYGEDEVRHYHALDEGFSGRKEIKTSMRARLLN